MTADIPWFNGRIDSQIGREDDVMPGPHAMYYKNLSLSSTYLLAFCVIISMGILSLILPHLCSFSKVKIQAFKGFIYNFFILGATIAGCLSLEGALLNPISSVTVGSLSYIVGIILYVGIFV